jgi:hypothetical protein
VKVSFFPEGSALQVPRVPGPYPARVGQLALGERIVSEWIHLLEMVIRET